MVCIIRKPNKGSSNIIYIFSAFIVMSISQHNNNNKFVHNLNDCEPYMLTNINLLKYLKNGSKLTDYDDVYTKSIIKTTVGINITGKRYENKERKKQQDDIVEKETNKFTDITEKDTLFWCFYIIKYGYDEYTHSTKRFSIEKAEKISAIQTIKKNKQLLKQLKLKKGEIETDLLNSEVISLPSFFALCAYNNINCFIIDGRKYFEVTNDNETPNDETPKQYSIVYKKDKKYYMDVSLSDEDIKSKIETYRSNYYKIENINKPIKAFSTCSQQDLRTICENLQISITDSEGKKLIKKEMYSEILKYF